MHDFAPPVLGSLGEYLEHYAWAQPTADALIWSGDRLSWRALDRAVTRWVETFAALGLSHGQRIGVLAPPRPEAILSFLAAERLGAVWLGLNPSYTKAELDRIVADARPSLIVSAPSWRGRNLTSTAQGLANLAGGGAPLMLAETPAAEPLAREWGVSPSERTSPPGEFSSADPLLLVYTSGSTGKPKGALLPRLAATTCARVQHRHWGARHGPTRLINPFPINHVAFTLDAACLALVGGGAMVLQDGFDPDRYLATASTERVNLIALVPTMHRMLLASPGWAAADLRHVELAAFGGAAASPDLVEALLARFGRVSGAYGSTETAGQILFSREEDTAGAIAATLGRPVPDYAIRLWSEEGREAAPGEIGEVQLREPFMLRGYLNDPEATAAAFTADGWLKTGDLASRAPDGAWTIAGRRVEAFKSGGYNIYPREIEYRLEDHPSVAQAAVVPAPDALYGEVGIAFVQPVAGDEIDPAALGAWCRLTLANFKVPKAFVALPGLPMLSIGKVDRRSLRARALLHHPTSEATESPCLA